MKKKVLIVEDSILMQRVLDDIIRASPHFTVCGCARDVVEGWAKFSKLKPDIVTLDYELPKENGLVLLERIMRTRPVPVVMVSAHTKEGAALTMRSLEMGAVDFFTKPMGPISLDLVHYRDELLEKLRVAAEARLPEQQENKNIRAPAHYRDLYVGIAASTGGVQALNYIIPSLPAHCGMRILIVQHMPPFFTASLAQHLNERSSMVVKEAQHEDTIFEGEVLVAPGGFHTRIDRTGSCVLISDEPPVHGVKPSADVLFDSMSLVYHEKAVAVVLTGMGRDASDGITKIKKRQGVVVVQDPADAVITGMPQAAINTGAVDHVVPLVEIPNVLVSMTGG
jgi:two-component system chemotaxis response regulator CheB